jgi:hypothetical protein
VDFVGPRISFPMKSVLASLLTIFILSCAHHRQSLYAIHELPDSLQTPARNVVNTGMVGYDNATVYLKTHLNDSAITLLSQSENPILRATALREMTSRPGFNHQQVMFTHLDDTAIVPVVMGEFGTYYLRVADNMIGDACWDTKGPRDSLAEEIIMHHDNLRSAYQALAFMPAREKYRTHIIKMIERDRDYQTEVEYGLFALAKYGRKEDISQIQEVLAQNAWRLSYTSFKLMTDYPDPAYFDILKHFYPRRFNHAVCQEHSWGTPIEYIDALVSYKNDSAAKILSIMLDRKPFCRCTADTLQIKERLLHDIWDNPCPAYKSLRVGIASAIRRLLYRDSVNAIGLNFSDTGAVSPSGVFWH